MVDKSPRSATDLANRPLTPAGLYGLGHRYQADLDKWEAEDAACDLILVGDQNLRFCPPRLDPRHPRFGHLAVRPPAALTGTTPMWDWEALTSGPARPTAASTARSTCLRCDALALDAARAATLASLVIPTPTVLMLSAAPR